MSFKAEWTGEYPNLCSGEWIVTFNSEPVKLPESIKGSSMNTYGEYTSWYFTDGWDEKTEYYEDGLCTNEWIEQNQDLIEEVFMENGIPLTEENMKDFYLAFVDQDFRHGSCGGCI